MRNIRKKIIAIILIVMILFPISLLNEVHANEVLTSSNYTITYYQKKTEDELLKEIRRANPDVTRVDIKKEVIEYTYKYKIKVNNYENGTIKYKSAFYETSTGKYSTYTYSSSEVQQKLKDLNKDSLKGYVNLELGIASSDTSKSVSISKLYQGNMAAQGKMLYYINIDYRITSIEEKEYTVGPTTISSFGSAVGAVTASKSYDVKTTSKTYTYTCDLYEEKNDDSTSTGGTTTPSNGGSTGGTTTPSNGGSTGGTTTPSNGGSTGGTTTPPNTGVISENTVYTNDLSIGDQLKFVANSWNIKNGDGQGNSGKYLSNGDIMEIVAKGATNNYLQVKITSGQYKDQTVWIYYGSTGATNFTKVKTAEITTPSDDSEDSKQTETLDNGTATENVIKFVKQVYGTESISKETQVVKDLLSKSKTASDVVSSYLMGVMNAGFDLEGFIKMTYQRALGREATEEEIKKYTESAEASEDKGVLYSKVVADVLATNEFKLVCEKYGVELGSYTATTYNADTTQEKASNFVKHLYASVFNKNMTTEQVSNIADNLVAGKITASGVMKAFFESDNIKDLKLSDEEFVKRLGKACFDQDLPSDKITEYTNKLSSGTNRNELLKEFLTKADFQNLCNTYGLTKGTYTPGKMTSTETLADEFVINVHKAVLGEDSQALSAYTNGLVNGKFTAASVIQDYIDSANFKTKITTENISDEQYVKILFKAVLQRDPSSAELSEYVGKLDSSNKSSILETMFNLKEFTVLCNKYYLTPGGYTTVKAETTQTTTSTDEGAKITTKEKTLSDGTVVKIITAVEFDVSTGVKGDVNGDGVANSIDASLILMYVSANQLNFVKPTAETLAVADIEGNKRITVDDASYVLQFTAKRGSSTKDVTSESIWEEILKEIQSTTEETTEEETNTENTNETVNNVVTNEVENNLENNTTVNQSTNNVVNNEIVAENIINNTTNSTTVVNETSNSVIE